MKKYHEIKQLIKPEMIEAGRQVFVAMAWVDTVKPIVKGYQQKILDELKPVVSDKWPEAGKPITLENDYLMNDKDFAVYLERQEQEMAKAGLKVAKKGFCPLLVAENELRKARNKLIETMKPITGIELDDLMRHYPDNYNKYFDLTLRLLAPFVQGVTP